MQKEILEANPGSRIRIFGVNDAGEEAGTLDAIAEGYTLPILQDHPDPDAWALWKVTWRDVVILDGDGRPLGVYNLTKHDLVEPANYEALLAYMRIKAGE